MPQTPIERCCFASESLGYSAAVLILWDLTTLEMLFEKIIHAETEMTSVDVRAFFRDVFFL